MMIREIRKKLVFTLFVVLLYRIGNAIPVPGINTDMLQQYFQSASNTILGLYNVMSGSAFSQATVFALSIQPYINASIIIQLLGIAFPRLRQRTVAVMVVRHPATSIHVQLRLLTLAFQAGEQIFGLSND